MKYVVQILTLLVFISCKDQVVVVDTEEVEHLHENDASEEEVHLVQKQMDVMDIEMGQFHYLNLSTTVKANGKLELPPQNKASLSTIMGGRVKSIEVAEGDYVQKGQTLAQLEHPDFVDLQESYMTSISQLSFIKRDYERRKELYRDSISSAKTYQQAEAEYLSVLARVNSLKTKLEMLNYDIENLEKGNYLSYISIRSPLSGYVRLIEINMGMYVLPDQEMFEIVDNEHIHIDLMVYEKDISKVKQGQKVIFSLTNNRDSVFQGSIFAIGKSFEHESNAMVVHAEIENKTGNLLPGMYVDARIVTNEEKVRAVPNDAIVSDAGLKYIFVLKPSSVDSHTHHEADDHVGEYVFRKIEVNTGAMDIGFTEVVPAYNIPDHIQIVSNGAFYLLAEMKKGEGGHGHHH